MAEEIGFNVWQMEILQGTTVKFLNVFLNFLDSKLKKKKKTLFFYWYN